MLTRSRSPASYRHFSSSVAQRVSRGLPRGVMGVSENMPIQRMPARMMSFSSLEGRVSTSYSVSLGNAKGMVYLSLNCVFDLIAHSRSRAFDEVALNTFWVASFHGIFSFKNGCASSERNPMSTSTLTNSGNPWNLSVPLMIVDAS